VISNEWRGAFENDEVNRLHAEAFGHRVFADDWNAQLERFSLGWVTARDGDALVGFVNVAWDGGVHAFLLDTIVAASHARQGIATAMVELAAEEARRSPCEWLHVDFEEHLRGFYLESCGFTPTGAGLIALA